VNILYYSPSNTIGGAELSLLNIICEANKDAHKCFVGLPPSKNNSEAFINLLKPHCEEIYVIKSMRWHKHNGINWHKRLISYLYNAYLSGWHFKPVFKLAKIIRSNNIQIVHTNTIMSIDAAIAAKLTKTKHVWHIREGIGLHPDAIVQLPLSKYPKLFKWLTDSLSSKVIANSKYTAVKAKPYFNNNKMELIYNSLSDNWFVPKTHILRKKEYTIGIVANVTSSLKNHKLAIETAYVIKTKYDNLKLKFNIYGILPEDNNEYYLSLLKKVDDFGLNQIIFFKGSKEKDEIYNTIDILFHPCSKESFGRIFIEAFGKGIPVVAAKGGGASELIEDGITGFKIDEDKPYEAADRIAELILNPKTYQRLSQNGYKYASARFKSSMMWTKIAFLYDSILDSSNI
jgi:glycosyltransferase involved in cell wall biosynthesis